MKSSYIFYTFILLFVLVLLTLVYQITYTQYDCNVKPFNDKGEEKNYNLLLTYPPIAKKYSADNFKQDEFIDSANWLNVKKLYEYMEQLDTLFNGTAKGTDLLYQTLTSRLEQRLEKTVIGYQPDTLIWLIQWSERFQHYAEVDKKNASFFQPLYDHWFNFVMNKLNSCYKANESVKYDYKFRYLTSRCAEQKYATDIGSSKKEKFVYNIIDQQWSYMLNRFMIGTSFVFKAMVFLFIAITVYGYYCIIKNIFKK